MTKEICFPSIFNNSKYECIATGRYPHPLFLNIPPEYISEDKKKNWKEDQLGHESKGLSTGLSSAIVLFSPCGF